jgi:hypothetical protein
MVYSIPKKQWKIEEYDTINKILNHVRRTKNFL